MLSDQTPSLLEKVYDEYRGDTARLLQDLKVIDSRRKQANRPKRDLSDAPVVIELNDVSRRYKLGGSVVNAVDNVSFKIHQGEMVALVGTSGSGKSTLLHMIGGLDKPTSGEVIVDGVNIRKMSDAKLSRYRGQKIGFVFQSFYLQPFLNVRDNIEIPSVFARKKRAERHEQSNIIAEAVGLGDRLRHYGKELSGGQIQRTAIARALMNQPKILLADEPTGNLDQKNAQIIFDLFDKARRDFNTTIVVVTHDENLAARMDRVVRLSDGKVLA